ncbi:hypothetical protein CKW48_21655, partial [Bordetella pertussis]
MGVHNGFRPGLFSLGLGDRYILCRFGRLGDRSRGLGGQFSLGVHNGFRPGLFSLGLGDRYILCRF